MPDATLPLFPLGLVLFPRTPLPLHIFEERYKLMIKESLDSTREFGVVLAMEKGIASVGCTTRIERVSRTYDDGRMDIETTGYRRFEIAELNEDRPFLTAAVTFFDDDPDPEPIPDKLIHQAIAAPAEVLSFEGAGGRMQESFEAEAPACQAPPSCHVPSPNRDWSIACVLVPETPKTPDPKLRM